MKKTLRSSNSHIARMEILGLCLLLFFAVESSAQTELPEHGTISDLVGKTKFYLVADAYNAKFMLKELKKDATFTLVAKPEDAEFFIEYKVISEGTPSNLGFRSETGQLDVYFYRDKKKVVAWSEASVATLVLTSVKSTKKFLKAVKTQK